jgi:hypothetical protein
VVRVVSTRAKGLPLLAAAAVILAGCVTEEGSEAPARPVNVDAEFGEDTGAIVGLVLDEEQLPIAGAEVAIPALEKTTRTADDGRFALNHLPPGTHELTVLALGYQPATQRVEVEPGRATDAILIELQALPSDAPFSRTDIRRGTLSGLMWKLTPTCIYTDVHPLVKTCGGVRFGEIEAPVVGHITQGCAVCETHTRDFDDFTPEWQTIVGEVRWTPQSGVTGKGFHFDINAPNITRGTGGSINQADPYTFKKSANKAPIAIRVDKDLLADRGIAEADWNNYEDPVACTAPRPSDNIQNCDWFYRLFPAAYDAGIGEEGFGPDYGVMYENTAEIHFSYFIREPAPADFTALPG